MSIKTLKIPFQDEYIVQGDTIAKTAIEILETDLDLTTATIKMQVYKGSTPFIDIENGNGITVIDAENLEIDQVLENNYPPGTYEGDLEIKDSNGVRFTYFRVEYTILKQLTVW